MVAQETMRFLLAARSGDLSALESDKVTETLQDDHGANCLHYAARGGSVVALKYLMHSRGFKATTRNSVGATPLHEAAATGQLEALRWFLSQTKDDVKVDDQDGSGATVTQLAARYGHTQSVLWLLDNTNCDVLKKSASGALAIHFAAEGGHLECVKILIAEAPRSVNMQMNNGCTPAYLACQGGHLKTAEYLAYSNGTPKIHTYDGMSPLHAAAQMGHLHIIKWLIKDQGLNPNERDFDGATALHYAASCGHEECVNWLMTEGGARIALDNLGGSPLHSAAEFGNNRIVRALLSHSCDKEITDNEGLTALELAIRCGHPNTAALLRGEEVAEEDTKPQPPRSQHLIAQQTLSTTRIRPPSPQQPPPPRPHRASVTFSVKDSSSSTRKNSPNITSNQSTPLRVGVVAPVVSSSALSSSSLVIPVGQQQNGGVGVVVQNSLENLPGGGGVAVLEGCALDRSMSQSVEVDVHKVPGKLCVFNSQETGEREIVPCPYTSSHITSSEDFSKSAASPKFRITSSTSKLSPVKPFHLQPGGSHQGGTTTIVSESLEQGVSGVVSFSSAGRDSPEKRLSGKAMSSSGSQQDEHSLSVSERKALLATAAAGSQNIVSSSCPAVVMENRQVEVTDGRSSVRSMSSDANGGTPKSVISISSRNITIISVGMDGGITKSTANRAIEKPAPKVVVAPLDQGATAKDSEGSRGGFVRGSSPISSQCNSEFIRVLSQKFVGNGPPVLASLGYRGSSESASSSQGEANSGLKPWQQAQQQKLLKRQQMPDGVDTVASLSSLSPTSPPPPPAPLMNGHVDTTLQMNGIGTPPPPPPLPSGSISQIVYRKPDASYTPRPKTFSSANITTIPGIPTGGDPVIDQQKSDLISALTAVVKSGSPYASLRRTHSAGKGGVNEVFSSKSKTNGSAKQPSTPLAPITEFSPKSFLDQVEEKDSSGNRIPDWKRHLKAKNLAQKAQEEYLEKKKVEEYEARFKNVPGWKRALIEKKEASSRARE